MRVGFAISAFVIGGIGAQATGSAARAQDAEPSQDADHRAAEPIMQGDGAIRIDPSGQVIVSPDVRPRDRTHEVGQTHGSTPTGAPMEIRPKVKP